MVKFGATIKQNCLWKQKYIKYLISGKKRNSSIKQTKVPLRTK